MEQKVNIVITSYYRPEFTLQCLEAIDKYTSYPHRVILIDNGSNQETLDTLWDAWEHNLINLLILNEENQGLEPAKNHAFTFVDSDLYVDSDNDIIVPDLGKKCWLTRLVELMEKYKDYAAIATTPQVFIGADKVEMFKNAPEVVERNFVGGSMRIMRSDVVDKVGGWRDNPKDMYEANRGEEKYICGKLKQEGWKVGYARDIECKHLFGEDGEWGYGNIPHYHRDQWPRPKDSLYE